MKAVVKIIIDISNIETWNYNEIRVCILCHIDIFVECLLFHKYVGFLKTQRKPCLVLNKLVQLHFTISLKPNRANQIWSCNGSFRLKMKTHDLEIFKSFHFSDAESGAKCIMYISGWLLTYLRIIFFSIYIEPENSNSFLG